MKPTRYFIDPAVLSGSHCADVNDISMVLMFYAARKQESSLDYYKRALAQIGCNRDRVPRKFPPS